MRAKVFTGEGQIRAQGGRPIVVVPAESYEAAKVRVGIGADDYLVKPLGARSCSRESRGHAPSGRERQAWLVRR